MQADGLYTRDPNPLAIVPYVSEKSTMHGRAFRQIPISYGDTSTTRIEVSHQQKLGGSLCCLMAVGLIVAGVVFNTINNPESDYCYSGNATNPRDLPACNPQLDFAGRVMWITGTSILGIGVVFITVFCCCIITGASIAGCIACFKK